MFDDMSYVIYSIIAMSITYSAAFEKATSIATYENNGDAATRASWNIECALASSALEGDDLGHGYSSSKVDRQAAMSGP